LSEGPLWSRDGPRYEQIRLIKIKLFREPFNEDASAPVPMGKRVRLKRDYDISGFSISNQVILTAMKEYGLILADIGSDMFLSGAPDERWDNEDLSQLKKVKAADSEVVPMGDIIYN
jgi:hypothetical protein